MATIKARITFLFHENQKQSCKTFPQACCRCFNSRRRATEGTATEFRQQMGLRACAGRFQELRHRAKARVVRERQIREAAVGEVF
jgi:hypothetical protein